MAESNEQVELAYRKREPFFALKYLRVLCRCGAMHFIHAEGFWLCAEVALLEDKIGYTRPIAFTLDALADRSGWSRPKVVRVRTRCVEHGWLGHKAGARGRPSLHWVEVPDWVKCSDDDSDDLLSQYGFGNTSETNPYFIRTESVTESVPNPLPIPPYNQIPDPNPKKSSARTRQQFTKPTLAEIVEYGQEIGLLDPEAFFDHYESNGWKVGGRSPMNDWRASMRNWKRNAGRFRKNGKADGQLDFTAIENFGNDRT